MKLHTQSSLQVSLSRRIGGSPIGLSVVRVTTRSAAPAFRAPLRVLAMEAFALVPLDKSNPSLVLSCPQYAEHFSTSLDWNKRSDDVHASMEALAASIGTRDLVLICQDPQECLYAPKGIKIVFRGSDPESFEKEGTACVFMRLEEAQEKGAFVSVEGSPLHPGEERCLTPGAEVEISGTKYKLERQLLAHA